MLSITAPIQLNISTDVTAAGDGFANRILSNYTMMSELKESEELLHITTQPPEYYFGGGETDNFFNMNTEIDASQTYNTEVISNLVNRILVEPEFGMTYQDRVYISNALRKYGIRNEQKFMNQVYALRQEVNQTRELIDIYWNNYMDISNMVEQYHENIHEEITENQLTEEKREVHLHEEIMNRLQTAAVYEIVNNFSRNLHDSQYISNTEINLSEQKRISEQIFLQRLKNEARGDMAPLVYEHRNVYETEQFDETSVSEQNVEEMINSAVLLNLIDNIYEQRQNVNLKNENTWIDVGDNIYEMTENSIERIRNRSDYTVTNRNLSEEQLLIFNEINNEEIGLLNEMINNPEVTETLTQNLTETVIEPAIERVIQRQTREEAEDIRPEFPSFEEPELSVSEKEGKKEEEETSPLAIENNLQILQNRLNQMNQQNVDNYNLYQKTVREEVERREIQAEKRSLAERQKEDSLLALTHPEELLKENREKEERSEDIKAEAREKALEMMTPENKVIFNLIEQYLENPAKLAAMAQGNAGDLSMLVRDINHVEMINREREDLITEREETVKQITNELTTEINHEKVVEQQRRKEEMKNLSFTHRTVENTSMDEITEQLIEQNRILTEKTVETNNVIENKEVQTRTVVNENVQNIEEINRNVENLINQSINDKVSTISDQVYRQMERKLESERRRRGL